MYRIQIKTIKMLLLSMLALSYELSAIGLAKDTTYQPATPALQAGVFSFHSRNFFMSTINKAHMPDHFAWAFGAGLHYRSNSYRGFRIGMGGFFIFNLASSDLYRKEDSPYSGSRYEIGLFDMEHPHKRADLDRLEELYLEYAHQRLKATIGRIHVESPYINGQDGRMRPTVAEGFWMHYRPSERLHIQSGTIWAISPRSTTRFFSVANSIGVHNQGVAIDGTKARYHGKQLSYGIGIIQLEFLPRKDLKVTLLEQFVHNIFNTSMVQVEYHSERPVTPHFGAQYHLQRRNGNGGNEDPVSAYYGHEGSQVLSTRIGMSAQAHSITANFTRISAQGRFLMPREWGREPFYTFMPRERNEGYGDLNAYSIQYRYRSSGERFVASIGYGFFHLPDVNDHRLNKYATPSYHQVNLSLEHDLDAVIKGLQMQLLLATKIKDGRSLMDERYVYNKVNLLNMNFVLNYHLQSKI